MRRPKVKPSESALDEMLGEASWRLSHAEALADYGREVGNKNHFKQRLACDSL